MKYLLAACLPISVLAMGLAVSKSKAEVQAESAEEFISGFLEEFLGKGHVEGL